MHDKLKLKVADQYIQVASSNEEDNIVYGIIRMGYDVDKLLQTFNVDDKKEEVEHTYLDIHEAVIKILELWIANAENLIDIVSAKLPEVNKTVNEMK